MTRSVSCSRMMVFVVVTVTLVSAPRSSQHLFGYER